MAWLRDLRFRLRALVARRTVDYELDEELALHVELETRKHLQRGADPVEARRRALLAFGPVAAAADNCRDERRIGLVDTTVRDVAYALRTFRRTPLTTLTIVVTIAIGLGLVATAFTLYNAYFLRPDAVLRPHDLVDVRRTPVEGPGSWLPFTRQEYEALRAGTDVFTDVGGMVPGVTARVDGRLMTGTLVTGNFFQVLGARPAIGRVLAPDDDAGQGRRAIVLSHRGWKALGGDASIAGTTIRVNGLRHEIVGVMPESFRGLEGRAPHYWAALALSNELARSAGRREREHQLRSAGVDDAFAIPAVIGRLRPGISLKQATAKVTDWAVRTGLRTFPGQPAAFWLARRDGTLAQGPSLLAALLGSTLFAFGLVLVIGCANVANLLLARGVARQREIGVRLTLGASRWRIVRQLLTESLLMALAAAALGLVLSRVFLAAAVYAASAGGPAAVIEWLIPADAPSADWRVAIFLGTIAILATAAFGIVPALQGTGIDVLRSLRGESAPERRSGHTRHVLIAVQVGASALLLLGAAVFLRGAQAAANIDHSVRTSDTLVVPVADDRTQQALVQEISRAPSVAALAVSAPRFGSGAAITTAAALAERSGRPERSAPAAYQFVSHGYFDVLGIRILRGRAFTPEERAMEAGVVVISERIARRLFLDADPLGRAVRFRVSPVSSAATAAPASERTYTIVGVVHDLRSRLGIGSVSDADLYVPISVESPATSIVVRVRGGAESVRRALLERLLEIDPSLGDIVTLQTMFGVQEYMLRIAFWTTAITGGLALVLTVSGLFGVLSYLVARRTSEIGVRMALGATSRQVARLVLSQSLLPVGIGLAVGVALTGGLVKMLVGWFQSLNVTGTVRVYDPVAYAASLIVIVAACVLAAWLPARRAARIDPGTTLRQE